MAMLIEAFGMPARHRHDTCAGLCFWSDRQAEATDLTLMALGEGFHAQ
jgi:hypothetical protein